MALAGLAAAAVAAIALARWVSRPLSALDAAAQRLGGGALDTRSAAGNGPPEVRRLARNFNGMAGRLESLVHGNRATMADVSHQLRTPLAALRLRLDVLSQDSDPETAEELAGAQDEIARLSHLVDGLLALARAENVLIEPVTIQVDEVVRTGPRLGGRWRKSAGSSCARRAPARSWPWPGKAIWSRSWTTCWPTPSTRSRRAVTSRSAPRLTVMEPGWPWRTTGPG